MKDIILFGAGNNGLNALKKYGSGRVAYFCDNDEKKQGTVIEGIEVIDFSLMCQLCRNGYKIVITPTNHWILIGQLEEEGIFDYIIFRNVCDDEYLKYINTLEKDNTVNNELLDYYVEKSNEQDLLENVSDFKVCVEEMLEKRKQRKMELFHVGLYGEGHLYGNLKNLLDYAEIGNGYDVVYAPNISHNNCSYEYRTPFFSKTACVFSGNYYKKVVHERYPYNPVFTVGPYIHYAKGIYSEEKILELKKNNGKTLVVFLPHSVEAISRKFTKKDFIDEVVMRYKKYFDTILLCVYWADILDSVCEYAECKGMKLVSNGFRFDQSFNDRQKSLMQLADGVVGAEVGTHLGYAMHMDIPVARVEIDDITDIAELEFASNLEDVLRNKVGYKSFKDEFYRIFDNELRVDKKQRAWMEPLQGFGLGRTPEYIRNVFEICEEIWKNCDGKLQFYPEAVYKVLRNYEIGNDLDKLIILQNALNNF